MLTVPVPCNFYGYTITGITLSSDTLYSACFYDNYSYIGSNGIPMSLSYSNPPSGNYGSRGLVTPRGLSTGMVTARFGPSGVTGYDYAAMYYDDRGQVVQKRVTNHLGGTELEYVGYDFTGHVQNRRHVHTAPGQTMLTQNYTSTYDYAGRMITSTHQLNNNGTVTLASNSYDELGRLMSSTHNGALSTTYTYNVRSWLKSITVGTLFSENLYYNESHNGNTPCYTENISAMEWKADAKSRAYNFTYDGFSRLTGATYRENNSNSGYYNTQYTYDRMGNLLTLKRYGLRDNSQYGLIDNLNYTYNGNQVKKITDAVSGPYYAGVFHFTDGSDAATEYEYDQNGNLTKDLNKNISSVQYNLLNLPSTINYQNGNMASYVYNAEGTKLSVTCQTGTATTTTQYCGNVIYENGLLKQLLIDGGYITFSGTTPQYHFYLKDHLGNNRVVVSQSGTVEQVNHYYPFGGLFGESTGGDVQRFKYNGKELDRMHGLDWYDYGARHLDAALGRWSTIDPMAEKYYHLSPYNYCENNPIKFVDPTGADWISAKYGDELFVYFDSRIRSQDDIIKNYYNGESRDSYDIQYVGATGTVFKNTEEGLQTYYTLNKDGSFADASGNIIDKEVSIDGQLHIGNESMIIDNGANQNWYGTYLGPNNPTKEIDKIKFPYYALPPKDKLDYAAFQHDNGYDEKKAVGYTDAVLNPFVYADDWHLSMKCSNDILVSKMGTSRHFWGMAAGTLFGGLAVLKFFNANRIGYETIH